MSIIPQVVINLTNEPITLVDVAGWVDMQPIVLPPFNTQPGGVPVDLSLVALDVDLSKSYHLAHLVATGKVQVNSTFLVSQLQAGTQGIDEVDIIGTPTIGQVPTATSSTTAVWQSPATTLPPSGPAGGGLSGTYPNPSVVAAGTNGDFQLNNGGTLGVAPLTYENFSAPNELVAQPASGTFLVLPPTGTSGSGAIAVASEGAGAVPSVGTFSARGVAGTPLPTLSGDLLGDFYFAGQTTPGLGAGTNYLSSFTLSSSVSKSKMLVARAVGGIYRYSRSLVYLG